MKKDQNNNNNFITLQISLLPADCRLQYGILEIQATACAVCAKNKQQFYKHALWYIFHIDLCFD